MPLILNGGRLLVSNGQLSTTTECCCNDRPGACWCASPCLYFLQLTSPRQLKSLPLCSLSLGGRNFKRYGNTSFSIPLPDGFVVTDTASPAFFNDETVEVSYNYGYLIGERRGVLEEQDQGYQNSQFEGRYGAVLEYGCIFGPTNEALSTRALYYIDITFFYQASAGALFFLGFPIGNRGFYARSVVHRKRVTFQPDAISQCPSGFFETCDEFAYPGNYFYLPTPLEIAISASGTSLGEWDSVDDLSDQRNGSLPEDPLTYNQPVYGLFISGVDAAIDSMAQNVSATFRITRRDTCAVVGCNCALSISGLKVRFEGKDFVLGTQQRIEEGNTVWEHDVQFSAQLPGGLFTFSKATYLPEDQENSIPEFGIATEQILLDMYCATDNEADPPESRWFVEASTLCQTFSGGMFGGDTTSFAQRLLIGYLRCYKGSGTEQCPGTAFAGQFIPLGDPEEIEEAEGSPFSNPELPLCDAPGFPEFSIDQDCTS